MNKMLAKIFALANAFSPIERRGLRIGYTWLSTVYCKSFDTVLLDLFGILQYIEEGNHVSSSREKVKNRAVMLFGTLGIGIDSSGNKKFRIYEPYDKPRGFNLSDTTSSKLNYGREVSVWIWLGHLVLSPILWLQYVMHNLLCSYSANMLLPVRYDPYDKELVIGNAFFFRDLFRDIFPKCNVIFSAYLFYTCGMGKEFKLSSRHLFGKFSIQVATG